MTEFTVSGILAWLEREREIITRRKAELLDQLGRTAGAARTHQVHLNDLDATIAILKENA